MDNIDKYISDIVRKKIKEPADFESKIRNTLKIQKKHFILNELVKKVAAVIISISAVGGIAFAAKKSGIFNNNNNNQYSIENNEYIQQLDMQYQTIDNLSVKIDSILLDDFKIELNIDYLYNEPITSAESKILITDENNNLIYENNVVIDYYENIFKKTNRNDFIEYKNLNNTIANDTVKEENKEIDKFTARYTSNSLNIESNNIKRTICLYSNFNTKKFPKSKKIYVQLQDIVLKNGKNKVKKIPEKMIFEIKLDERYINNRKTYNYNEINNQLRNNEFSVIRAELSNTQLLLKIKYSKTKDITSLDLNSLQIWNEKDEKYIIAESLEVSEDNIILVNYDVNSKIFSDTIKGKIGNQEFWLQKSK